MITVTTEITVHGVMHSSTSLVEKHAFLKASPVFWKSLASKAKKEEPLNRLYCYPMKILCVGARDNNMEIIDDCGNS